MAAMTESCDARCAFPFQDDWTDEADEFHDEGDVRPLFGQIEANCLRESGHAGEHRWPDPSTLTVPQPTRALRAELLL